jgi:hypothetical protein
MENMKQFCRAIRKVFENTYLHQPINIDIERQIEMNYQRGLGMFTSIDYIHYQWKNCPIS